jgi:hypothetical protein
MVNVTPDAYEKGKKTTSNTGEKQTFKRNERRREDKEPGRDEGG